MAPPVQNDNVPPPGVSGEQQQHSDKQPHDDNFENRDTDNVDNS